MDDRQRQFAHFASALNQFAGTAERNTRDRSAVDGRSSTGSTSSGSSNCSTNAAALWGDLGRAFSFNYSGFPSASSWPSMHQGGSDFHRYGSYGGFCEGSDNRSSMDGRSEGRRVPSKGETKATPPLPPTGMGSAIASLQQLVGLNNEDVYRTLIAQQYAAAFSLPPTATRPPISPISHSNHSTISPNQIHPCAASSRHLQQQLQIQISRQRQHSKSPSPLPILSTLSGSSRSSALSPDNSLNGDFSEHLGRSQPLQLSPMASRKERLLEQFSAEAFQGMRATLNPTQPKSTSLSPNDCLTTQLPQRGHEYNAYEQDQHHQVSMRLSDAGMRSGSESEGDQRFRHHKRKQDQPKRQTVIYSNHHPMSGLPHDMTSSVSAESSSEEDSQGYDSMLTQHPGNESRDTSIIPSSSDQVSVPPSMSQAMSHALSHPFLAAHLNSTFPDEKRRKVDQPHSQYRADYDTPSHLPKDLDGLYHMMKEKYSSFQYRSQKLNSVYDNKNVTETVSYLSNSKERFNLEGDQRGRGSYAPHHSTPDPSQQSHKPNFDPSNDHSQMYYPNSHQGSQLNYRYSNDHSSEKEASSSNSNLESSCHSVSEQSDKEALNVRQDPPTKDHPPSMAYRKQYEDCQMDRIIECDSTNGMQIESNIATSTSLESDKFSEAEVPRTQCPLGVVDNIVPQEKSNVDVPDSTEKNVDSASIEHNVCNNKEDADTLNGGDVSKDKSDVCNKVVVSDKVELLNGDHVSNQGRKAKRKQDSDILEAAALSPELLESKRPTRQRHPVSYVEDETDPVLETNEDQVPLFSPVRKRGRRCKDPECHVMSPSIPAKEARSQNSSYLRQDSAPRVNVNKNEGHYSRESYYSNNVIENSRLPTNISEPLHIDTCNNYNKPFVDIPSTTEIICSPDIYDFNDLEGDVRPGGSKMKRGRRRGSPRKGERVLASDVAMTNFSPVIKENSCSASPCKFLTDRNSLVNHESPQLTTADRGRFMDIPKTLMGVDILKPPLAPPPLLPNSSSIVDEVEMQLAALHKEHIADAESRKKMLTQEIGNEFGGKEMEMAVHKPLLSVVPLEQLTYEGMQKKHLRHNEVTIERICKDPGTNSYFVPGYPRFASGLPNNIGPSSGEESPLSSPSSFAHTEEKSDPDLSENIHLYNENFDSEGERNFLVTKRISSINSNYLERSKRPGVQIFPVESAQLSLSHLNKTIPEKGQSKDPSIQPHLLGISGIAFNPPAVQVVSIAQVPPPSAGRYKYRKQSRKRKLLSSKSHPRNETDVKQSETLPTSDSSMHLEASSTLSSTRLRTTRSTNSTPNSSLASFPTSNAANTAISETEMIAQDNHVNETFTKSNSDGEGETLEDIARFLEDTAPRTGQSSLKKVRAEVEEERPSTSKEGSSRSETSYKDARPKRVSRPPPEMNDGEMNDLLLLLNMEDEESDDEDYIPKDTESAIDSEGHETGLDSEGQGTQSREPKKISAKKKMEEIPSTSKKSLSRKISGKGKIDWSKKKFDEKYDRRGPIVKVLENDGPELILNTPDRDEEEEDSNKRLSAPFSVEVKSGKVGYSSTLHSNYNAFEKDLNWFCAFCKNYSHYRTLGDLFGPFFVKGLALIKKNFPEIVEGQVTEVALSPTEALYEGSQLSKGAKPKPKKSQKHDTHDHLDGRKEFGGSSPPVRFIPAATPARMLGRGSTTLKNCEGGSHNPVNTPKKLSSIPPGPSQEKCLDDFLGPKNPSGTEMWLHEACICWSSGVSVVNSKLYNLDEAVLAAQESVCNHCGETGATVCCLGRGCSTVVHVPCARLLLWKLDSITFQSFCQKHYDCKGSVNMKGKSTKKS